MGEHVLTRKQSINLRIEKTFEFFADAANLEKITPPELQFNIITPQPIMIEKGTFIDYTLKLRGFPVKWRTEISQWEPPFSFIDRALKSPYSQWIHLHKFESNAEGGTDMVDEVRYRLPFEPFGDLFHWYVKRELDYIFDYRRDTVASLLNNDLKAPV